MTYFIQIDERGDSRIFATYDDGSVWLVPEDENNVDYQNYLAWLSEQETKEK